VDVEQEVRENNVAMKQIGKNTERYNNLENISLNQTVKRVLTAAYQLDLFNAMNSL